MSRGGGGKGACTLRIENTDCALSLNEINKRNLLRQEWPMKFSAGDKPDSLFREIKAFVGNANISIVSRAFNFYCS